jgi:hypothetical protein
MSVGMGRQNINTVLEITVSFLGIHKSESEFILDSHWPFIFSVAYICVLKYQNINFRTMACILRISKQIMQ